MLIGLGVIGGLAVVAIGAWAYVMSNVKQPSYVSVTQDGAIEVRDYPALVVAEVTRRGDRNSAVRAGFAPLASYIFAKNRSGDSISMTAPVTQTRETGYKVVFVPFENGRPSGMAQDVVTGFLAGDQARGRPVGVDIDGTGALLIADDAGNTVWRVAAAKSAGLQRR